MFLTGKGQHFFSAKCVFSPLIELIKVINTLDKYTKFKTFVVLRRKENNVALYGARFVITIQSQPKIAGDQ